MNKRLEVSREGLIWIEKGRENRPAGNQKGKGSLVRFESHYYTKESVTIALSAQDEDLLVEVSSDASRKKESLSIGDWYYSRIPWYGCMQCLVVFTKWIGSDEWNSIANEWSCVW